MGKSEKAVIKSEKKNNGKKALYIIISVILAVVFFLCGFFVNRLVVGEKINSLSWAVSMIDKYYYVEEEGRIKEFTENDYVKAMIGGLLDDYSDFYSKEEYKDVIKTNNGNNYGFGISFLKNQTTTNIYRVALNSPLDKGGAKDNDLITAIEINGIITEFSDKKELMDYLAKIDKDDVATFYLSGEDGEKVITAKKEVFISAYVEYYDKEKKGYFYSEGVNKLEYKTADSDKYQTLNTDTCYISLKQFEGQCVEQIKTVLQYAKSQNKTKIILDLRDNGGGDMQKLLGVASYFISGNDRVIAIAKEKNKSKTPYSFHKSNFDEFITDICVLANCNSASASECLIGAMLYYNCRFSVNNLIIEKKNGVAKTFGKGIMQTTYQNYLTSQAIKLTTAYIYQPDGRTCIHNKGITTTEENSVEKNNVLLRATEILG